MGLAMREVESERLGKDNREATRTPGTQTPRWSSEPHLLRKAGDRWSESPVPYLLCVDASRHRPGGHDVVHDSLTQPFGHLVELQEIPDTVEHLVVPVGVGVHLLENGCHVPEDGGIEKSWRHTEETTCECSVGRAPACATASEKARSLSCTSW